MSEKFWRLTDPDSNAGLAEWDHERVKAIENERGQVSISAVERTDIALPVLLASERFKDFVWTWYSNCLVQDRVLELFKESGFTGFEALPIEARIKKRIPGEDWDTNRGSFTEEQAEKIEIPRLWEIMVTGWGGVAPPETGIRLIESSIEQGEPKLLYSDIVDASHLVDRAQWDGSDFFIVWPLPRYIFVTDRVAHIIQKHKLEGCKLQPSKMLTKPSGIIPGYRPIGLRHYLPEPKAREIGQPLGIY